MDMMETTGRTIHVDVVQHRATGLFMAFSRVLPGLRISGRTLEEVEGELAPAIKALVEATEKRHVDVSSPETIDEAIDRRYFTFVAEPAAA